MVLAFFRHVKSRPEENLGPAELAAHLIPARFGLGRKVAYHHV